MFNYKDLYKAIRLNLTKKMWKTLDPYDRGKITLGEILDRSPIKIWHIILFTLYILSIYRMSIYDGRDTLILTSAVLYFIVWTFVGAIFIAAYIIGWMLYTLDNWWYNLRRKTVLSCKRADNTDEMQEE